MHNTTPTVRVALPLELTLTQRTVRELKITPEMSQERIACIITELVAKRLKSTLSGLLEEILEDQAHEEALGIHPYVHPTPTDDTNTQ